MGFYDRLPEIDTLLLIKDIHDEIVREKKKIWTKYRKGGKTKPIDRLKWVKYCAKKERDFYAVFCIDLILKWYYAPNFEIC
jgi:hypothetical protein